MKWYYAIETWESTTSRGTRWATALAESEDVPESIRIFGKTGGDSMRLAADVARALNCHDELVAALEQFTIAMRRKDPPELMDLIDALHVADAALAKAKGGAT